MATNTSQDRSRSVLGHIAIRTRRVNSKTCYIPLSSSMSTQKPSKSSFVSPTVCPKQSSNRTVFFRPLMSGACLQRELISCLTTVVISEKLRQRPIVEFSWLPSRAKPPAISFPQTFTCDSIH
ncbi:hypothetical protein TNCV_4107311 [Trichonephila clavipes]|nr:hypothetical protein TNCV_4107311 [Trichonephila clavipes]